MSKDKDIERLLAGLKAAVSGDDDEDHGTLETQLEKLTKFVHANSGKPLEKGDIVVLNENGKVRYKFPRKGQIAMVSDVFDKPMVDDDGHVCNGTIAVYLKDRECVNTYTLDLRCYKRKVELKAV